MTESKPDGHSNLCFCNACVGFDKGEITSRTLLEMLKAYAKLRDRQKRTTFRSLEEDRLYWINFDREVNRIARAIADRLSEFDK